MERKKKFYLYRICSINENDLYVMKFGVFILVGEKIYLVIILYIFICIFDLCNNENYVFYIFLYGCWLLMICIFSKYVNIELECLYVRLEGKRELRNKVIY